MPGSGRAEVYFIAAMMILIMILSVAAVVIFIKTYKKEMREKEARLAKKASAIEPDSH
ncbi:MAG TPA: hypothetical protein VHQ01_10775 [Pyrinomonadaceae bacterium]|nr:hypothetical protein [Pyrinomonadaceae bacterium]